MTRYDSLCTADTPTLPGNLPTLALLGPIDNGEMTELLSREVNQNLVHLTSLSCVPWCGDPDSPANIFLSGFQPRYGP